ncbi:MAG TPA: pyrimidine reductase family protein [Pilimelia sp.]|nr:pyrimidine reductase family protein [Pilimelia sp.]
MTDAITRLWPQPGTTPLDDDALADAYAVGEGPNLRVNFVTSLDGAVELESFSAGLSGPADKRVFAVLRMLCDALLVGAGTLRHESYRAVRLSEERRAWRLDRGLPAYPILAVVSRRLALDPAQAAFADAPVRPIVFTCAKAPPQRRAAMSDVADVVVVGDTTVDVAAAVAELHRRGLRRTLCEGGPQLFGGLTAADLVDEICLTLSPLLAGPGAGRITAGATTPARPMSLRHVLAADDMLLLRYARA